MEKEQKIGIGLIPKKPTVAEVDDYIVKLAKHFPDFKTIIFPRRQSDEYLSVLKNQNVELVIAKKGRVDAVAAGYYLMAAAAAMELDWLFFNVGIKRYSPEIFAGFIKEGLRASCYSGQMVFCSPPDISPSQHSPHALFISFRQNLQHTYPSTIDTNEIAALEHDTVRKRILVDTIINYVFSRALNMPYSNINAGLFGIHRDAIKYLISIGNDNDSSLLCSQMLWRLKRSGGEDFVIKSIPVKNINMEHLGFSQEKAANELAFVMDEAGKAGRWIGPRQLASDFFAEKASFNRWVTRKDEDWFFTDIIPPLEKALLT